MSEPVKTAEIEDVLSSIRRLVSDDHRQTAIRDDVPSEPAPERLVLTEALRVSEPEASIDHIVEAKRVVAEPFVLEASQTGPTEDVRSIDSADQNVPHDQIADHDAITADTADRTQYDIAVQKEVTALSADDELTATLSDQDTQDPQPSDAEMNIDAPWLDPDITLYKAAEFATVRTSAEEDHVDQDVRPLGEKIAALEEVIGRTEDQWEPDGTGLDDYAGTEVEALDWEETEEDVHNGDDVLKEDDVTTHAEQIIEESVEELAAEAVEDEAFAEATLDEAALRALVADIVREELQGVLGERITRNVRKLVRREIQRALAVKDLE